LVARIVLFDLDGVLVHPGGYRAAYFDTVGFFLKKMNLAELQPDEQVTELFEAQSITSEWDMVPLTLCLVLDAALSTNGQTESFSNFQQVVDWVRKNVKQPVSVDYEAGIRKMGRYLEKGRIPADTFLIKSMQGGSEAPFPNLAGQPMLNDLLSASRDAERSWTTRIFQNHVLGKDTFEAASDMQAEVEGPSYLKTLDRPALSVENSQRLKRLAQHKALYPAAFTLRPSLPPSDVAEEAAWYSPEAEMALSLVGLEALPMIAFGRLYYLSRRLGLPDADRLLKPAPIQALAAIAAAWSGREWSSLVWAARLYYEHDLGEPVPAGLAGEALFDPELPEKIELHVFEDSAIGMIAAQEAAMLLHKTGVTADIRCWGISPTAGKAQALEAVGAQVYPDVNIALAEIFSDDRG
jgi:hypothetical protein